MTTNVFDIRSFIGIIVSGTPREIGNGTKAFDVTKVLGSGFVIDPSSGLILTCNHVLPKQDRESGNSFAFFMVDNDKEFRVFPINCNKAMPLENIDVLALELINSEGLETIPIKIDELSLGTQVITIGYPLNHLSSTPKKNVITPRAIVSHIVSGYPDEYETDKPFITTMSGSPVIESGSIVGIATLNREYAINQYLTEKIVTEESGAIVKKECYEYSEIGRFGVFSKASSWSTLIGRTVHRMC